MARRATLWVAAVLVGLVGGGCARTQDQAVYRDYEVGQATELAFATVLSVREVQISGDGKGVAPFLGAATGAAIGSAFGQGGGNAAAIGAGLLIGLLVGSAVDEEGRNRPGLEYTLVREDKTIITLVQNVSEGDRVFQPGERVTIQRRGSFQRVLSADHLPPAVYQPQGLTVVPPPS